MRIDDRALAFAAQVRDLERRQQTLAAAFPEGAADKGLAKLLKTRLYPYQAEGTLFVARGGRVLLDDQMGLGKTVQAIAAAELLARHIGVQRVLVVCPTSLKQQWQREWARFAGRDPQAMQALRAARQQQYQAEALCRITRCETLVRDTDLVRAWAPELLIVDEAQRSKNRHTQAARALKRLQCALQNMRMACNSTWLLDHGTDFGHKADELVTPMEDLFEDPEAEAVVFSRWLGTHEVLMRRLRARG